MNNKIEKDIVLYYLNTLVKRPVSGEIESRLCNWFENHSRELIGRDIEDDWEHGSRRRYGARPRQEEGKISRCVQTIRTLLEGKTGCLHPTPEVSAIIKAFHFSPKYHDVLTLFVHVEGIPSLNQLFKHHSHDQCEKRQMMAGMLDLSLRQYEAFLSSTSELIEKGLFRRNSRGGCCTTDMFDDVLDSHCRTPEAVKRVVLGKPQKATLQPEHFEHLREEYDWLRNLLTNALAKQQCGVNILIYGKPGTGKTELAKTLCKKIGAALYAVSGNEKSERNGGDRRSDLAAALCLLEGDKNSALLMDEAEDVFEAVRLAARFIDGESDSSRNSKSKLFFHKLLESNAVPVIWVCNSIRGVDPAHLRRFSYALNMEAPDEAVQQRIWDYSARKNKVKLPKEKIGKLVKSYDIAPAIIDASLRTAALTGDHEAIEKTIDSLQTAMGYTAKREFVSDHEFSTALLNCDTDLENLARQITAFKGVNFSLCLYGVPGAGKSAYARFLAEKLKMKVLHKRASDLLSMWLGNSEKNIAAAFAEAKKKKMLLVIDEADSMLRDRRNAQRSWEVSTVNEMLTQMESHPLPFVCTTNLMDDLDQASLRRFTFKVKYDYLTQQQTESAFKHFFGAAATVPLGGLMYLSPGDFAVVAKKANICGIADHCELVTLLRQEQEVKDVKSNPIGFAMS
jgi:SpoVK/Ycf46/Vps4 family AAA+-type ATPase